MKKILSVISILSLFTLTGGSIAAGETVTFETNTTINGDLTMSGAGILNLGVNTLTLDPGKYTQAAGTTLNVNIASPAAYGKIVAGGAAVVAAGGTVNVTVGSTFISGGTTFTVISGAAAGALTVPTITSSRRMYSFTGVTSGNDLVLTAVRTNPFNTVSTNSNANVLGAAWEEIGKLYAAGNVTGNMAAMLSALDNMSSVAEIAAAIETMMPNMSAGLAEGSCALTGQGLTMISNRLGSMRSGFVGTGVSTGEMLNGIGVWMQGLGSHIKQDARKGIEGYKANLFGTTIGADKVIGNHFRIGLAGGYGLACVKSKQSGSPSDNINSFQGTLYGSFDSLDLNKARHAGKKSYEAVRSQVENSWYVDGMFSFTQNNYDSRREIWLGADKYAAKAEHYGQQYSTSFEAGYKFVFQKTKNLEVTPFASLGYNYLYMNKYKEKGADVLNLNVQDEGFHQLEQGLGLKLAYPIAVKKAGTFIPSVKAAWLYDYIGDRFESTASFAGGGPSFTTKGAKPAKNGCLVGGELAFLNKGNVTVTGNYDLELKDEYQSHTYYGTVRYDF